MKLSIGDRIYYTGDMANIEGEGTIIAIRPCNRFGPETYDIVLDDGREFLGVYPSGFDPSPGRRFWLLSEWEADHDRKLHELFERYENRPQQLS